LEQQRPFLFGTHWYMIQRFFEFSIWIHMWNYGQRTCLITFIVCWQFMSQINSYLAILNNIYTKQHIYKTIFIQNNIYTKHHLYKTTFIQTTFIPIRSGWNREYQAESFKRIEIGGKKQILGTYKSIIFSKQCQFIIRLDNSTAMYA
jgi:hypothetical protein